MEKNEETLERICFNCSQFLPASMEEATEFGICLNDQDFEPFIEELLDKSNYASCQELINSKKFLGQQEACEDFDEMESIEIEDDTPLGQQLKRLCDSGDLTPESFKAAIFEERIRNIDWKTVPVDQYVRQLKSPEIEEQKKGVSSLGGMIALGNKEAFKELFNYFTQIPPPKTVKEVHFKIEVLRQLKVDLGMARPQMIPYLIDELYKTPSNNTTRQWISAIFRFLEESPDENIREPLEKMLEDKRFSYRLKKKIKYILYSNGFSDEFLA